MGPRQIFSTISKNFPDFSILRKSLDFKSLHCVGASRKDCLYRVSYLVPRVALSLRIV